jgi:tetratricopeptide (TPR) repeat protein
VPENPRLEELRRRVQKDPASIAFAQLAEEHRRAGEFDEAIRVARTGLDRHPGYISARVTLGRALLEAGAYEDAQAELELVIRAAPDNLAAIRALAELHQRREEANGEKGSAITDDVPAVLAEPAPAGPITDAESAIPDDESPIPDDGSPIPDPCLIQLESWLAAIVADREQRGSRGAS